MTGILSVSDLVAGYSNRKILNDLTLCIKENAFVGIIGPNGSGKSTFMQVLARNLSPDSGTILLGDELLETIPYRKFGQDVAFVPQDNEIPFAYSVYDIVMMGRNPRIPRFSQPSDIDKEAVRKALTLTGTEDLIQRDITSLSGGERQRVLIARVIAQDAGLLLLDEPFAHLDLHHQHELFRIMRNATRIDKTVIGIFHDINLAATYCDLLIVLFNGRVAAFGSPADVLTEDLLKKIFRIDPVINKNPISGTPYIYVNEKLKITSQKETAVHVISGGGSGFPLISQLNTSGYKVSCGVLSMIDTDFLLAEKLGLETISEPPFTEISNITKELLKICLKKSDRIILTSMPIGNLNFSNLLALEDIDPRKIILITPDTTSGKLDYTGGKATDLLSAFRVKGATIAKNNDEVIESLSKNISLL